MNKSHIELVNKNYGDNERKTNYTIKRIKENKSKSVRDRGDTDPIKHSRENMNTKSPEISANKSNLVKSLTKTDKRDANIYNKERKRDKRFETNYKSKNILEDEANEDCSVSRNIETKPNDDAKLNISRDRTANNINKKPLIKTVTDTDDATRKYKAVTFTEQKLQKSIEIKLPNFDNIKHTKIPKLVNKNKIDNKLDEKVISKRSAKFDKKFKHKREVASPARSQDGDSPPTEIAKWSTDISEHTKPYYEAWINSTLAAISNKNERMYLEKQKIIKSFKKALEQQRSKSPELLYENYADERFTGRIKINHK